MLTRAAARKRLSEATGVACSTTDTTTGNIKVVAKNTSAVEQTSASVDEPRSSSRMVIGVKRKRERKQTQPLKGGWVLPHGMGVGTAESDTLNTHDAQDTLVTSAPPDSAADASSAAKKSRSVSRAKATKKAASSKGQTRLSLRVTKVGSQNESKTIREQSPVVKLEEPDSFQFEEDEEGSLKKRPRTVSDAQKTASDATATKKTPKLIKVKVEEKAVVGDQVPKVLIIRGVKIIDDVVSKTSSKIIVDASQLLDPDFRVNVKRGKDNPYGLTPGYSPYPYRRVPTPEACEEVHRILTEMHGEVKQPEKIPAASLEVAGCGEVPCVLDALLRTLISGNTLMALADAAIKNLAQHYGLRKEGTGLGSIDWDKVRLSPHRELAEVIKVAGNGPKRSQHIKQILDMVYEENSERGGSQTSAATAGASGRRDDTGEIARNRLSLDHMHGLSKDEAMAKFVSYPGIGIKTAACVTLFCLRMPCFAVDTHVHKFCRWLGWVPEKADPDNCFRHGDFMVPNHLKYGLHQLFIRHGQLCFKCRKATKPGTKDWNEAPDCPLEHLLDRSKDEAGSKPKRIKEEKEEPDFENKVSDDDADGGDEEEGIGKGDVREEDEEGEEEDDDDDAPEGKRNQGEGEGKGEGE